MEEVKKETKLFLQVKQNIRGLYSIQKEGIYYHGLIPGAVT